MAEMSENENYVRARWERIRASDYRIVIYFGEPDFLSDCHMFSGYHDKWSEARLYTEHREREIAEVEEEIEIIEAIVGLYASHGGNKFRRILAREQAVLAELRRGMKEKP